MKLKNSYFYTLRENAKDEDSVSGNLLVKGGFIKKTSAGVYMFMPMGLRVYNKIENIIRDEMNKAGALEMKMPALIASEYYEKSGRLANFGPSIFKLKDRNNHPMVLGPTHEELFVNAASSVIRSYKDMPFNIYQIQTKFRDEPRARFGLIRVKEFVMKDAYSFDTDEAGLDVSYQKMFNAYKNIFDRLGLNYRIVKADTGVMGGLLSEEFQAITDVGEDIVVYCDDCDFSSNIEIAECVKTEVEVKADGSLTLEEVYTPNAKTIKEVCDFLNKKEDDFVKTLIYNVDGKAIAIMLRGDREVSETKVQKLFKANSVELADPDMVFEATGAHIGFAGPVNIKCPVVMDNEILAMPYFIVGANKDNYHLINVSKDDFKADYTADIRQVKEGDVCPKCGKPLRFAKGIEVGNTFKLGTKYSEACNLTYLDSNNKNNYPWMGCYGIGLGRCMASVVEQCNDENGIIWPENIAPFTYAIVIANTKDETQVAVANKLYEDMLAKGVDVVLDDRDERAGVKFKDMELIGIPHRITVGRRAAEGIVETRDRTATENVEVTIEDLLKSL